MNRPAALVVFVVEDQLYAIPLTSVSRVVFAVEVASVAHGPACLMGVVDVKGRLVPVMDLRRGRGAGPSAIGVSDYFVLTHSRFGPVALVADDVVGVVETTSLLGPPAPFSHDLERLGGAIRLEGNLVLIEDMDRFLTEQEHQALERAMNHAAQERTAQ